MKNDPEQKAVGKLGVLPHSGCRCDRLSGGGDVSREVVKGKTGTVTVFAFDEGQGLSEPRRV